MLKIATINTWKGEGEYNRRLELLADGLKGEAIDILCCQESFRSLDGHHDTALFLAGELGMSCSFTGARRKKRLFQGQEVESLSGLAILTSSRISMLNSGSFPLPGHALDKGRVAQYAVIRQNGDAILIVNLHLSHLRNGHALRRRQLQAVFSHPIMDKPYAAILLCGDFNAMAEDRELATLKQQSPYRVSDGFLAGGGNPRLSTLVEQESWNNLAEGRRIDHIFVLEMRDKPVARLKLSNSRLILDRRDDEGVMASDHLGVALDLTLSRVKQPGRSQIYRYLAFSRPWHRSRDGELTALS